MPLGDRAVVPDLPEMRQTTPSATSSRSTSLDARGQPFVFYLTLGHLVCTTIFRPLFNHPSNSIVFGGGEEISRASLALARARARSFSRPSSSHARTRALA